MKYRVGDKVIIKHGIDKIDSATSVAYMKSMSNYCGRIVHIYDVCEYPVSGGAWYKMKEIPFIWDVNWFEPYDELNMSVTENELCELLK